MNFLLKKNYREFLLKSTNAHGVHSPFVYNLVTLCLRKKRETIAYYKELASGFPKVFRPKHIRILNDLVSYLQIQKYAHFCENNHSLDKLPSVELLCKVANENADLIYLPEDNFNLHHTFKLFDELKSDAVLVIENPYRNASVWKAAKKHSKAHIVIDTYFFGFIFNRKQQAKEHFYIRI